MVNPGSGCAEAAREPCTGVPVRAGAGLGAKFIGAGDDYSIYISNSGSIRSLADGLRRTAGWSIGASAMTVSFWGVSRDGATALLTATSLVMETCETSGVASAFGVSSAILSAWWICLSRAMLKLNGTKRPLVLQWWEELRELNVGHLTSRLPANCAFTLLPPNGVSIVSSCI